MVLCCRQTCVEEPKESTMAEPEVVRTESVELIFDGQRCIHARHCVLSRPDVFVPNVQGAWLHPELATTAEIAELAHACPSGAIQYRPLDGTAAETAPKVNLVSIRENGPLAFHAELRIQGQPNAFRATLCRCGASANKPYCDGSHHQVSFQASGEPPIKESAPLETRNGVLSVVPAPNGPLLVKGSLEIVTGTGATIAKTMSTALCRCGQSANKPYCDGSHVRAGFRTD
jgi:CDGSH-type Zn-finger protein